MASATTDGLSPGQIQFSPTSYAATNQWGSAFVRALGSDGPAAVFLNTVDGSAVAGVDFVPLVNASVAWAAGEWAPVQVPVAFKARVLAQDVVFSVALTPADGATQVTPAFTTATITIQAMNPYPGDLGFADAAIDVAIPPLLSPSTPFPVFVPVQRLHGSFGNVQVQFALVPVANLSVAQVAVAGVDFALPAGNVLFWTDGDAAPKVIALSFFNSAPYRPPRTLTLALQLPVGGAVLAAPSTVRVTLLGTIQDAPAGVLQLSAPCFASCAASTYTVQEGGAVRVFVQRLNGTVGVVSVQIAAVPDPSTSTIAGIDFVPQQGTLTWQDGDGAAQSFVVATQKSVNTNKRAVLRLLAPTGGSRLSATAATSLIVVTPTPTPPQLGGEVDFAIVSLEQASLTAMPLSSDQLLQPEVATYQSGIGTSSPLVLRAPGVHTFTVRRARGRAGAASVVVQTVSHTATPGVDYIGVSQLLSWADGDSRDIAVPVTILAPTYAAFSGQATPPRSFSMVLSNPSNVVLGSFSEYLVLLQGTQQVPVLTGVQLDMTTHLLTLQFSAPVTASTANVAAVMVQASALQSAPIYALSASAAVVPSADATLVVIQLAPVDVNAIENRAGLATSAATTYVSFSSGFVRYPIFGCSSTTINACIVSPLPAQTPFPATSFVVDAIAPSLIRFTFDGQYLLLRFTKVVDVQTVLPSAVRLCDSAVLTSCTTLTDASYVVTGTNTLLPPVPSDGTLVTIFVGPRDQTAIQATGSGQIGVSPASTFVVLNNQIQDPFQHTIVPPFSMGALLMPDCSACPVNSYASSRCSDVASRVCMPCTVCGPDHYAKTACTTSRDTVCQQQYAAPTCTPTADRVCNACTQCSLDQYEASACTTEANRICGSCNSCALTPAQKTACMYSVSWQRLQRSPYGCPTVGQQWTSEEQRLQAAKSHECGAGRCSCTGNGVGNNNPNGLSFPDDIRCTGPAVYGIVL
ncbi:hypothetical protein ACHHYP_14740 [Achlya hypogyna]|uniref:TNFR-Cys domain-containing protein n=1 Tax=Achlya hypogyna TaxID=1202772 RepID=A0A1V9YCI8_ACHHY|nr:hypothetical protein ACHHYP_14740 [Achlya hypogyna]